MARQARESTRQSRTSEPAPKQRKACTPVVEEKPTRSRKAAVAEEAPAKRSRRSTASEEVVVTPAKRTRKAVVEEVPAKRRSSRVREEDIAEEQSVKKTRRSKAQASDESETEEAPVKKFNPYGNIDDMLDDIDKKVGLSDSGLDRTEQRLSTGLLMLDIILGGGITAGWYTNFGQEQSCKTTGAVTILAAALNSNVPLLSYWDYEGSASPDYIENIMRNMGLTNDIKSVFGVRDEKSGKWVVPPRVRYKSENIAEKFFDYLASLQRKLPDKKRIGDSWYYIYEDTKENRKLVGSDYDMNYWRKTKMLRVPAPDGSLQALVLLDSYPAMLPERLDVDDPGAGMAAQARMFSDQLKRVKGRMRGKRVAVIGINQLRLRPAVMMGNPEYEAGGEALKLYSDVRLKYTSRALSAVAGAKGKGQIEEEPSVLAKGKDNYRYIHIRGHKNKLSRPYMETFVRLWITDAEQQARGFDLVWDTYQYLLSTGQLSGSRTKAMTLKLAGKSVSKPIKWLDFKRLVLCGPKVVKPIMESIGLKPFSLRAFCVKQMADGKGIDMFNDNINNGEKEEAEEIEADDSDD